MELEKEIITYVDTAKIDAREALLDLRQALTAEAVQWSSGGLRSVHKATVLLAFLCQLERQGWLVSQGFSQEGQEVPKDLLRGVRPTASDEEATSRAPYQRGLDRQSTGEYSDALLELSQILARYSRQAWPYSGRSDAFVGFPLATGLKGRVAILRGAGNALVAPQAQAFIECYLEVVASRSVK